MYGARAAVRISGLPRVRRRQVHSARGRSGRQRRIELHDLAREPFVLFPADAGPTFHAHLLGICAESGFTPSIAQEAVEWQTLAAFVAAGLGVTIAPASIRALRLSGVAYRAFTPRSQTTVSLCWRDGDRRPIVHGFVGAAADLDSRSP